MNVLNRNTFRGKALRAFSLTELLVVLVIIGILVLVAMPNQMPLISRAKATEALLEIIILKEWIVQRKMLNFIVI